VEHGIDIRRIRVQALAYEQACFAVGIPSGSNPLNIRRERDVAGGPSPHKLKFVTAKPHIRSAAGDPIGTVPGIIDNRPTVVDSPDISVLLKQSERQLLREQNPGQGCHCEYEENEDNRKSEFHPFAASRIVITAAAHAEVAQYS
jgi:hypothetical protein